MTNGTYEQRTRFMFPGIYIFYLHLVWLYVSSLVIPLHIKINLFLKCYRAKHNSLSDNWNEMVFLNDILVIIDLSYSSDLIQNAWLFSLYLFLIVVYLWLDWICFAFYWNTWSQIIVCYRQLLIAPLPNINV